MYGGIHTMNTTRPRSPETFKCLFSMSSRNGTTTVHPAFAIRNINTRSTMGGLEIVYLVD